MQHGSSRNPKQEALPNAIFGHESKNWTALHEAVVAGDDRRVEILLSSNADRMAKESNYGNTPLHEAASRGFSRCVKLISTPPPSKTQHKEKNRLKARVANTIEALHNSTLGIINNEGLSALHLAVQNGHNQSSRELLMAGADPDVQNNYGDTPLHTACRYGHAGATRILLSAMCDPNKTNLNGDTALHITCAMGRRKLTRILLESEARLSVKNAQGETPQHIAMRKNYREILDILNTPKRIRNRREKPKESEEKKSANPEVSPDKVINWSPYGCHYFPDPRAFPSPKLETLPKEPLKSGEQYFLDLAGHIHKGPVSVGNTCYCGPFFRHIENKLNCNRKSLKKYVNKTKERLGHKVQALAIKTNDQIEQLTRTMIADRIRCENKRQYLNEFLRRGEPFRATFDNQSKCPRIERTLSRCRSLELLESTFHNSKLSNSRSVELLEDQAVEAVVHQPNAEEDESDTEDDSSVMPDTLHATQIAPEELQHTKLDELKLDFLKVSERLGDLLEKTTLIMERDSEQESKRQLSSLSPDYKTRPMAVAGQIYSKDSQCHLDSTDSPNFDDYTNMLRRYPNSSETSNPSQNSNSWECETSPTGSQPPAQDSSQKYYHRIGRSENMLHTVIKALRKDVSFPDHSKDEFARNENADKVCGDKLLYKELVHEPTGSSHNAMSNLMKRQPLLLDESYAAMPTLFYTNPHMSQEEQVDYSEALEMPQNPTETVGKLEIRNSEIKCLKTSNAGQVRGIVAQLQGKIDSNAQPDGVLYGDVAASPELEVLSARNNNFPMALQGAVYSNSNGNLQQFGLHDRHIPKDAYFHELPNRSQNPQLAAATMHSGYLPNTNTNLYPAEELYGSHYPRRCQVFDPNEPLHSPKAQPISSEYVRRSSHLFNQPRRDAMVAPMMWRGRLPPDGELNNNNSGGDIEEMPAGSLYNNVSSLV